MTLNWIAYLHCSSFLLYTRYSAQSSATSLLAEHEVTQLIRLTTRIAAHLGLEDANNPELAELQRTVAPEAVLEQIEDAEVESAKA